LVTNVDYPAIFDIDNDGDLDILTFWGLGSFMELHQNMSVETLEMLIHCYTIKLMIAGEDSLKLLNQMRLYLIPA
jgi:hypothetical protein